ncbi:uncharacterized protein LOC141634127 [Silene latifolia]|uniref:uncharacterized protein LOC141634127 n=1 Tax=Silene latifolia TaxID=37657 RepID=UPI003D78654C
MPCDLLYWRPSRNGEYTVRSGYWLGMSLVGSGEEQADNGTGEGWWKVVWGLRVPPKLIHFVWRACTGMLAVKSNLLRHHCCGNAVCDLCWVEEETEIHALLQCPWTRSFWGANEFDELIVNARIFEKEDRVCPEVVVMGFTRLVSDYQGYVEAGLMTATDRVGEGIGGDVWTPPENGVIKINSDAAIIGDAEVGLGVVGRDSNGEMVLVASKRCRAGWSVKMAEAKAVLFGMEIAKRLELSSIIVETDALNVIHVVKKNGIGRSMFDLCIKDVCELANSLDCRGVVHVKRGGNTVAHLTARLCSVEGDELVHVIDFPPFVLVWRSWI